MRPIEGKPSVESPDRIGAPIGDTRSDSVSEVPDVHEAERFWAQADAAAAWRHSLPGPRRAALIAAEADAGAAFDGIK